MARIARELCLAGMLAWHHDRAPACLFPNLGEHLLTGPRRECGLHWLLP